MTQGPGDATRSCAYCGRRSNSALGGLFVSPSSKVEARTHPSGLRAFGGGGCIGCCGMGLTSGRGGAQAVDIGTDVSILEPLTVVLGHSCQNVHHVACSLFAPWP